MPGKMFFDTNILVYLIDQEAAFHEQARQAFGRFGRTHELWISRQVLREYAVVMSREDLLEQPSGVEEIAADLSRWQRIFRVADETSSVTQQFIELMRHHGLRGKRLHDLNIVATMLAYGIEEILTNNVGDFDTFDEITVHGLVSRE
jgi:predicted nucleic acid-binding protein